MSTRNDRDLDDLLSDDAGRIGASYRKLGKPEPPRRLDRNVLAEASRAVHGRPRASRWLLGVGTAAGVLLAGGIAWRVNHDMLQQRESAPMSSPAVEAAPTDIIRVEPRDKSADDASRNDTHAPTNNQPSAAVAESSGAAVSDSKIRVEPKAGQAKQKLDNGFVADPAMKKAAPKSARSATSAKQELREQSPPTSPTTPAPLAPARPAAAAPMLAPAPEESKVAEGMLDAIEAEESAAPKPMQESERMGRSAADGATRSMQDGARRERSSASNNAAVTAEISRIRALLRAGQREAAVEALRELRREHPEAVLPADLRSLDG